MHLESGLMVAGESCPFERNWWHAPKLGVGGAEHFELGLGSVVLLMSTSDTENETLNGLVQRVVLYVLVSQSISSGPKTLIQPVRRLVFVD